MCDFFALEADFEAAVIESLQSKGWDGGVIRYPSEKDLIENWKRILFENNRQADKLNGVPMTDTEMGQILQQVKALRTPCKLNGFINGGSVSIVRDATDDAAHLGKAVSLDIYDRNQIQGGKTRYQIVEQPRFPVTKEVFPKRRGDLLLLINGMPMIHIELKRSGVSWHEAAVQIDKYNHEGAFSGIFSLVQMFVAMDPTDARYFAAYGPDRERDERFFFCWEDVNNEPVHEWSRVVEDLLNIPMAHQMIGYYSVADDSDGVLKVMRSYQANAAMAVWNCVRRGFSYTLDGQRQRGGYVWHTTGSGKTMTSFKTAQLITYAGLADKVVFLIDRVELGDQSLANYNAFTDPGLEVAGTDDTAELVKLLLPRDPSRLIVTSIQKLKNISPDGTGAANRAQIEAMGAERIVFIVDECHRSTFGEMMGTVKRTFRNAMFFGFTGTPITDENKKNGSTTADVFGDELVRYTIADGIRDKNVLGFDVTPCPTYSEKDLRRAVAFDKCGTDDLDEIMADEEKKRVWRRFVVAKDVPMAGEPGTRGIEDMLPAGQYLEDEHEDAVAADIVEHFTTTASMGGKFSALFATSSIEEAVRYYRKLKAAAPRLKVTAVFDPTIDNNEGFEFKEDGLVEVLEDYDERFGLGFTMSTWAGFKRDVAARLAHKKPYRSLDASKEGRLDIVIVVDQMLTGYDSKWVSTLYLDKMLADERVIQAFSRTNRIFDDDKPFGVIRYYRKVNTMAKSIDAAIELYSGSSPKVVFVDKIDANIEGMNDRFERISELFAENGIGDFSTLPESEADRAMFTRLMNELNDFYVAARVQGFDWRAYEDDAGEGAAIETAPALTERDYLALVARYKELASDDHGDGGGEGRVPYDIRASIAEMDTQRIDNGYINARFEKWLRALDVDGATDDEVAAALDSLHRSFSYLSVEQQRVAESIIIDIKQGSLRVAPGQTLRDLITERLAARDDARIAEVADGLGIDGAALKALILQHPSSANINAYGRFDVLLEPLDEDRARAYLSGILGRDLQKWEAKAYAANMLRAYVLSGGEDTTSWTRDA